MGEARFDDLELLVAIISMIAAFVGSLLGTGGGVVLVPALTLGLGMPPVRAVGISLFGVVATSAFATFLARRPQGKAFEQSTNQNILAEQSGLLPDGPPSFFGEVQGLVSLELIALCGALLGGFIGAHMPRRAFELIFGGVAFAVAWIMQRSAFRSETRPKDIFFSTSQGGSFPGKPAQKLESDSNASWLAAGCVGMGGVLSGLLGIGAGVILVPVFRLIYGCSVKEAIMFSSYMVGLIAAGSALIYDLKGAVEPALAVMAIGGAFVGVSLGRLVFSRISPRLLSQAFVFMMIFLGIRMWWG